MILSFHLTTGKFSIIFDKEAAGIGSALKSNKRKHKGTSTLHICQVCNKEFKDKKRFIRHKLSHSTEKAHSCKECKKSFKHLWTLTKHVKMKHSCELSGKYKIGSGAFALLNCFTLKKCKLNILNQTV